MPQSNPPAAVFLQFAKWPEAGRVKTRLMPELGAVGALEAHVRLTLAVLDNLCATGYPVEFWWDRPVDVRPGEADSVIAALDGDGLMRDDREDMTLSPRLSPACGGWCPEYER